MYWLSLKYYEDMERFFHELFFLLLNEEEDNLLKRKILFSSGYSDEFYDERIETRNEYDEHILFSPARRNKDYLFDLVELISFYVKGDEQIIKEGTYKPMSFNRFIFLSGLTPERAIFAFKDCDIFIPHEVWNGIDRDKYRENVLAAKYRLDRSGFPCEPTEENYLKFLEKNCQNTTIITQSAVFSITMSQILSMLFPIKIHRKEFNAHTYIVGRSGSGKTELIKSIFFFLQNRRIILDPHGDLADEVRTGNLFGNPTETIFIAPHEKCFVINPFDIHDKSEANRELVAQEITDLIGELVEDSGLSRLMMTICFPIIYTLLKLDYSDFKMFSDCINPNGGQERLKQIRPFVEPHLLAIWNELEGDTYDTSKQSVFNRLQSLLNYRLVTQTLCGRDDFEDVIRKVEFEKASLVVSLPIPVIGGNVSQTLGRFFMTRVQIWAKRRQRVPEDKRASVYLIVDEFQNFMSKATAETLDQFGRKFRLFMTLAHQHIGQLQGEIKGSVLANTRNKLAGVSDKATRQALSHEIGCSIEDLANMSTGHWIAKIGNSEWTEIYARRVKFAMNPPNYAKSKNDNVYIDGWTLIGASRVKNKEIRSSLFKPKFDI